MRQYCIALWISLLLLLFSSSYAQSTHTIVQIDLNTAISPAAADYFQQGLEFANKHHASALLVVMDTPGGLDDSMRTIISAILNSPIPVITYVAPNGARAASAGTYILYASHIAAMAPSTHLGAATPVQLSSNEDNAAAPESDLTRKMKNDAVAYLQTLADLRHRNADWGKKAILEGATLTASQALNDHVIDLIASDIPTLLNNIQNKTVTVQQKPWVIDTMNATIIDFPANWRVHFLELLTNPSLLYLLFILAFYGLLIELTHPGYILPGVVGAISLVLSLYAMHLLPVNYTGVFLMLLGISFMVAEAFVSSFGALGIGGVVAFVIGSIMLLPSNSALAIPIPLILFISLLNAVVFIGLIGLAMNARRRKVVTGKESLLGRMIVIPDDFATTQFVKVGGESWAVTCEKPLQPGLKVKIVAVNNLVLTVTVVSAS